MQALRMPRCAPLRLLLICCLSSRTSTLQMGAHLIRFLNAELRENGEGFSPAGMRLVYRQNTLESKAKVVES
jgi:hypothetical protein